MGRFTTPGSEHRAAEWHPGCSPFVNVCSSTSSRMWSDSPHALAHIGATLFEAKSEGTSSS